MTIKGIINLVILIVKEFITKLVLPTYDVYGDWFIVYKLLMGNGLATGQHCKQAGENILLLNYKNMKFY